MLQSWPKLNNQQRARAAQIIATSDPAEWAEVWPRIRWLRIARESQLPPPGDWSTWLFMAGRGGGKTRSGAEWVNGIAETYPGTRTALVAADAADARDVMVEGESGILSCCSDAAYPLYEPSKRRITWPNGSIASIYSADSPEKLRGPQHHAAWCDEMGKWRYQDLAWSNLKFGLRLKYPNFRPQIMITTTPRPTPRIRSIIADPTTTITRDSSYANRHNLDPDWFAKIITEYEGTRLGRQELMGELLEDHPGALWSWADIEPYRITNPALQLPTLKRIVVALDPSGSDDPEKSDEFGIVVSAKGTDDHYYILADYTLIGNPKKWSAAVVAAYYRHRANVIVYEKNYGGQMIPAVLARLDDHLPCKDVWAKDGKRLRAEPVTLLYQQGRVHHVGRHDKLETEMTEWDPDIDTKSPNRVDALVHGLTYLSGSRTLGYAKGAAAG